MPTSVNLETEVKDAMLVTLERETANGSLWFPRKRVGTDGGLGDPLAAVFLCRTSRLSGLMQQVVRLACVLDHAGSSPGEALRRPLRLPAYLGFLHHSLPQLTTAHFRSRIATAQMRGCFPGDFRITSDEITLLDPRLAVESGSGFGIGFNQMPEIAAALDILHNMLGYPAVAEILKPVLQGGTGRASDVANELRREIDTWLLSRLGSQHIQRQTKVLRAWCRFVGIAASSDVTHAKIAAFWCDIGSRLGDEKSLGPAAELLEKLESISGFRMIGNACQAALRYHAALCAAEAERNETRAVSASTQSEEGEAQMSGQLNLERANAGSFADWVVGRSPLGILCMPPARHIKWLTGEDIRFLWPAFGDEDDDHATDTGATSGVALFAAGRPDDRFLQTLLFVQTFHGLQSVLTKSKGGFDDVLRAHAPDYSALAAAYQVQAQKLIITARTAAFLLLQYDDPAGVALTARLAPLIVAQLLPDRVGDISLDECPEEDRPCTISPEEIAVLRREAERDGSALRSILQTRGFSKVNRQGFSGADLEDRAHRDALSVGADGLERLMDAVVRLTDWFGQTDTTALLAADAEPVLARLRDMYAELPRTPGKS